MACKRFPWVFILCFLLAACFLILASLSPIPTSAQDEEMLWERLDVEIVVLPDGDFWVHETHVIRSVSGGIDYIIFKIPANHLTSISDVQAWKDGQPCATGYELGQSPPCEVRVDSDPDVGFGSYQEWYTVFLDFSSSPSSTRRTCEVRYRVHGGLRYDKSGDQLWWKAVRADYRLSLVQSSRVTVHLPEGAVAQKTAVCFADATQVCFADTAVSGIGTSTVVFEAPGTLAPGQELEVRVQFPHGVVAGSAPTWQQLQKAKPMINLASVLLGGLLAGGGILLGVLERRRERRLRETAPLGDVTRPPSDMLPGVVAALVDHSWGERNLQATLIDLARRGYLRMEERVTPDGVRVDGILRRTEKPDDDLLPYERMMLSRLMGRKRERSLSDLEQTDFYVEKVGAEVYRQLIRDGYFRFSPGIPLPGYLVMVLLIIWILGIGAAYFFVEATAKEPIIGVICPFLGLPLALGAIGSVIRGPVETSKGAEEAARWEAFKRYLREEIVEGDAEQFMAYLPYALAFGISLTEWTERFAHLGEIPLPEWFTISYCDSEGRSLPIPEEREMPESRKGLGAFLETASDAFRQRAVSARRRWWWK